MTWTHLTDIPGGGDWWAPVCGLAGKLYVIARDRTFSSYAIATNTWATLTPPPDASDYGVLIASGGLIYWLKMYDFDVHAYDPVTDTWAAKATYTGNAAQDLGAIASDGTTIWMTVGDYNDSNPNGAVYNDNGMTNIAAYTIATDTWDDGRQIPPPTTALGYGWGSLHYVPAATGWGGPYLVYVNGWWDQDDPQGETTVLDLTDPGAGWVEVTSQPFPREDQAQGYGANDLHVALVVGGDDSDVNQMATAQAYDPYGDIWHDLPNLPVALDNPALCVLNSVVYLFGDRFNNGIWSLPYAQLPNGNAPPPPPPPPVPPELDLDISASLVGQHYFGLAFMATPGFLSVSVSNVPAGGLISFRLDTNDVAHEVDTAYADDDGNLTDHRVFIDHVLTQGAHRLYASNADNGDDSHQFVVNNDEVAPEMPGGDHSPTLVPRIGVQRWYFQDPTGQDPEFYNFPRNPEKYTTPYGDKVLSYDWSADPINGHAITMEGAPKPVEWSFTGNLLTKDEEAQFVYWYTRPYRIFIVDHENRAYTAYLTGFDVTPHQTMQHMEKREYTMKATLYGPPVQLS